MEILYIVIAAVVSIIASVLFNILKKPKEFGKITIVRFDGDDMPTIALELYSEDDLNKLLQSNKAIFKVERK